MSLVLKAADYWRLRAVMRDEEVIELDALKAAQQFAERKTVAQRKTQAVYLELAERYGFDPTKVYGWDDETQTLIPQ